MKKTPAKAVFVAVVSDITGIKAFEKSYCFIKPPILVENGSKVYEIIVPGIDYLPKVYENLEKVGSWKVLEIKGIEKRKADLTDTQKTVLKIAYDLGYFSDKRCVKVNDIATAVGLSKSTAHKHLRIAVSKLVEKYIQERELEKTLSL